MNDIAMLVLIIVLIVFVVVLIVLAVNFIGTVRKVNKTLDELQPTINTANKMLEDIQPAIKRVDPLVERVSLTVDAVNLEIMRADAILSDISEVTSTATGAVGKVADIAEAPLNLLYAATDKIQTLFGSSQEKRNAEKVVRNAGKQVPYEQEEGQKDTSSHSAQSGAETASDAHASAPVPQAEAVTAEPEAAPVPQAASVSQPAQPTYAPQSVAQNAVPAPHGQPISNVGAQVQPNSSVQVNYTPDFEPDDDIETSQPMSPDANEQDGFYLFYTDDEGVKDAN